MGDLVPVADIRLMAEAVAKSGLFGVKTPDQAMALMLIAQAEGMHPAIAARDYHVIQGRPSLKADAMLARFQDAGGKVQWVDYTDEKVTGTFSHPAGGRITVTWTIEQARSIGLTNKDNWRDYPRAMLRSRCVSEGIRAIFPGCVVGTYTDEEIESFDRRPPPEKVAPIVDHSDLVTVEDVSGMPIVLPGGEVHAYYNDPSHWAAAFKALRHRISNSAKLSDVEKNEKIASLTHVNADIVNNLLAHDYAEAIHG